VDRADLHPAQPGCPVLLQECRQVLRIDRAAQPPPARPRTALRGDLRPRKRAEVRGLSLMVHLMQNPSPGPSTRGRGVTGATSLRQTCLGTYHVTPLPLGEGPGEGFFTPALSPRSVRTTRCMTRTWRPAWETASRRR